jgi:hypothetical protein
LETCIGEPLGVDNGFIELFRDLLEMSLAIGV